jgi:hypothetical protein
LKGIASLILGIVVGLVAPCALSSQQIVQGASTTATPVAGVGVGLPSVNGFNFVLSSNSQYDDAGGFSSTLSPLLSYRLNRYLSIDTGLPLYLAVDVQKIKGTKLAPVYLTTTDHGVIGDTGVSGHLDIDGSWLSYSFTASGAFPTGNAKDNLSANTKTYSINNHFEHSISIFTPDIEIGVGNSSNLVGRSVRRGYVAVGPLATFQAGTSIDLPSNLSLDFEAYESMPIGNQKVYGTVKTRKGKTVTVLEGTGVAEDNGFNVSCSFQPSPHFGLSAFYNRSLRQYDNTTGFSLTYIARTPKSLLAK